MKRCAVILIAFAVGVSGYAAPGVRDLSQPTTITNPGSYRVVRNFGALFGSSLIVDADHVTLDLNGFQISQLSHFSGAPAAIEQKAGRRNLTVRNGSVSAASGHGILAPGFGTRIEGVTAHGCALTAVLVGPGASVEDLVAVSNAAPALAAGDGAVVHGLIAYGNTLAATGAIVRLGAYSRIREAVLHGNTASGSGAGLILGPGSSADGVAVTGGGSTGGAWDAIRVEGNGATLPGSALRAGAAHGIRAQTEATGIRAVGAISIEESAVGEIESIGGSAIGIQTETDASLSAVLVAGGSAGPDIGIRCLQPAVVRDSVAANTLGDGFVGSLGVHFRESLAAVNGGRGFVLVNQSAAVSCLSVGNGDDVSAGAEAGFATTSDLNVLEDNHAWRNWRGYVVGGAGNLLIGNSSGGHQTFDYGPVGATNSAGALYAPATDQPYFTSDNPWANFDL